MRVMGSPGVVQARVEGGQAPVFPLLHKPQVVGGRGRGLRQARGNAGGSEGRRRLQLDCSKR